MDLLSHPFRLERNGAVATVVDGTEQATAEAIAVLALTRRGERTLVPRFGVTDPVFDEVTTADLNVALRDYGPDTTVTAAEVTYPDAATQRVALTFTTTGQE